MVEHGATSRQVPRSYPTTTPYENSSTSSTPSLQESLTPSTGMSHVELISQHSTGPDDAHSYQSPLPPGLEMRSGGYSHPYEPLSPVPDLSLQEYPGFGQTNGSSPGTPDMSHTRLSSAGLQAQKRAYRQRRKDPSCDACRERKCDATDTASCSECSSRSVKCQFTKETNRRMSSIKQVQDLERQLAHARQQLSHLRSVPRDAGSMEPAPYQPSSQPVGLETNRSKRPKPGVSEDFLKVRSNLRRYGHGIFRPPRLSHRPLYLEDHPFPVPELPPKHIADELLQYYHTSFHIMFPILRWSSFTGDYEAVYREGSLKNTSPVWMALLFAVFAWGSLNLSMRDGQSYLAISKGVIDRWMEAFELDHVRCAIISSIFMFEINLQSAGWAWLGFTVRIAQDLGLHFESEHWSFTQRDVRRRVWWSIYACDRYAAHKDRTCPCINAPSILSLELERPCMINDEDCEVELPVGPEDDNTEFTGSWRPSSTSQPELPFLSTLRVVRETSKLFRILRRSTLSLGELQSLDLQFNRCMAAFPAQHHIRRNEPLDLRSVTPLIYLQNARLVLHRRNLTTACAVDARLAAIDHCTLIAQDTTQLLSRCMMDPLIPQSYRLSNHPGWAVHLRAAANSFLCTHIWRCTLFLCLRGSFEAASVCVRASATIGDARLINLACGRYVDFFLDELTTKLRHEPVAYLDKDEELIAYASGDLQRSIGCSWVWHAGGGVHRQPSHSPMTVDPRADEGTATAGADEYRSFSQADWDGLLEKLSRLSQEQQPREDRRPKAAHGFPPGATGEPIPVASTSSSGPLPGLPSSSSRISIADIM